MRHLYNNKIMYSIFKTPTNAKFPATRNIILESIFS